MSIAVLGTAPDALTFEVSADKIYTWQEARRSASARWATQEVYAGKPKSEFLGPGLATISLSIRLDIERGVIPRDELRKIRKFQDGGIVLQFTVGGELVGDFVIKESSEEWRRMSNKGVLMTASVSVTLEEYA